jgi:hypothetical protein
MAPRLYPGGRFGLQSPDTTHPSPGKPDGSKRETAPDGFSMLSSDSMCPMNESHRGRSEPRFLGLHNLAGEVLERALRPPKPRNREALRKAVLWDEVRKSFRKAIANTPSGSYVVVCSNSGPYHPEFEDKHPAKFIPEASCGVLLVSRFRD